MIRKKAEMLTELCFRRHWIQEEQLEWCVYALEKWISLALYFLAVLLWMAASGYWLETTAFLVPFYLLRRRIGGCHANTAKVCFLLSVGIVVLETAVIGRLLAYLPCWLLLLFNGAVSIGIIAMKPAYPPQVNFTEEEKQANAKRKNALVIILFCVQLISIMAVDTRPLAHSFCGFLFSAITVLIQKYKLRGEPHHEET